MAGRHVLRVIDAHGGGNPTRIIVGGVPRLDGATVAAQQVDFAKHWDHLRTAVTLEPRGGALTSSAVLVRPADPRADVGVFFMEPFGYPAMCGSDTISLVAALIETGQIATNGQSATVRLETPAGLVTAQARVTSSGVENVTFTNVPGFLALDEVAVRTAALGELVVDVAYGGNFYVLVPARSLDLDLAADVPSLVGARAKGVLQAAREQLAVQHPTIPALNEITHVMVYDEPSDASRDARVQVVVPPDVLDRSPCGTGTTARVAALVAKGRLQIGGSVRHTSLTGLTFTGRALREVAMESAVGTEVAITGSGHVIGDGNIYVDGRDPLTYGFSVK